MHYNSYFRPLFLVLPFILSGCVVTDWMNTHMPVYGDRCENWQCFTASGQQQSDINRQQRLQAQAGNANANTPASASGVNPLGPTSSPAATPTVPASTPSQPVAPSMPAEGAYKYVPRAPSPPGTTPYDGQ